jgi:hypothetical protein
VDRYQDRSVAVVASVDEWPEYFDAAFTRIAERFKRAEPRWAARDYLLAVLPMWTLARVGSWLRGPGTVRGEPKVMKLMVLSWDPHALVVATSSM